MSTSHSEEIDSIGARLREERARLSLSQADLGEILDVDRKVVRFYEENKTSPRADQLARFHDHGADIVYIITGMRLPVSIRDDMPAYLPRDIVAKEISMMNISEFDAELLIAMARRLSHP